MAGVGFQTEGKGGSIPIGWQRQIHYVDESAFLLVTEFRASGNVTIYKTIHNSIMQTQSIELPPILKYPGGKTKLVPRLKRYYDLHRDRRYVAPFCGGLGDVLGLMPQKALLNDSFPALINLYHLVQKGFEIKNPIQHSSETFYKARERFNTISTPLMLSFCAQEAAELLVYLNRHCFNGLIRSNSMGGLNTPIGKPSKGQKFLYPLDYRKYSQLLKSWEFTCGDFSQVNVEKSDYLYLDPPYDEIPKEKGRSTSFTQYGTGIPFGWERQEELAVWASKAPCPVLLSNHATERIVGLYSNLGANLEYVEVKRPINSKVSARSEKVMEILASWRMG